MKSIKQKNLFRLLYVIPNIKNLFNELKIINLLLALIEIQKLFGK